jgi:hypothetical protein
MSRAVERTFQGLIACRDYRRTWAFPREVADLLKQETRGLSVLHLFGGQADFGVRLDADRSTRPHVIGNAFYPPFGCESFDVVICDPPYRGALGMWESCMRPALCLARKAVWWFSPHSMGGHGQGQRLRRWWAVVPSEQAGIRYLVEHDRIRHPPGCRNRKALPAQVARYDWRSHVEHPNLPFVTTAIGKT